MWVLLRGKDVHIEMPAARPQPLKESRQHYEQPGCVYKTVPMEPEHSFRYFYKYVAALQHIEMALNW